jgi:hypothetical protein
MRLTRFLPLFIFVLVIAGQAQTTDPPSPPPSSPATVPPSGSGNPASTPAPAADPAHPVQPAEDKRVFGVIPNNRTTESSTPFSPISAKHKMTIAAKDSFDWPTYPTAALFASLYQLENQNPSFGQGMAGYGKRLATAVADQTIGNMMTEGIVPSLIHQDPRYFRIGADSGYGRWHRAYLSVRQIVVARMDSGHLSFNFSEWGGNAIGAAISNAYYPDTRNASDNAEKLLISVATDAFSNILKEFWPDVKHYFRKNKNNQDPLVSTSH